MYASTSDLNDSIANIQLSPKDSGTVELIVCRPGTGERKELDEAELDITAGLIGDNWLSRGHGKTTREPAHPEMQLNIMNSRAISIIAKNKDRWKLAGDQFFVDFDLSPDNLPPGTQLIIGDALIKVTEEPHLGCQKFVERFGKDAVQFVNSTIGKSLNLRGINAKVIKGGKVKVGSIIQKAIV